jgi:hypothetical protein
MVLEVRCEICDWRLTPCAIITALIRANNFFRRLVCCLQTEFICWISIKYLGVLFDKEG